MKDYRKIADQLEGRYSHIKGLEISLTIVPPDQEYKYFIATASENIPDEILNVFKAELYPLEHWVG